MSDVPAELLYSEEHEYLKAAGNAGEYFVGITDYAQGELGDIVFVEMPKVGETFARMATFGTVEAVKAVSDLYMPVAGEILEVNGKLSDDPAVVNSDPYGGGWMVRIRVTDPAELEGMLNADAYREHVDG
jgi:glycine cleavage system H protein